MPRFSILILAALGALFIGWSLISVQPENTVILTEHGFSPRELTVSLNDTVTFVNKRDKYFWVASDFHPTHTNYPEFDAQEALPPGSSWSFTFDTPGLFKYHDHLAPFYFGIVRVKDENGTLVDNCTERGGEIACWQDQIFVALAEEGIGEAYDTVADLYRSEPTFAGSCHFIAHNIGLASYGFWRENPDSVISPKASACASGFYHGFMEAYLGAVGDVTDAAQTCENIGERLLGDAPDARLQCYHGIGHGVMELILASRGVFGSLDETVAEALRECERASSGEAERYRCASGLFNGIANFYINGEHGLDVATSDPLALCARQPSVYQESCYGNMNSVAYWMAGNDFDTAARHFVNAVDDDHTTSAIEYLSGLHAYYLLPDFSDDDVVRSCQALGGLSVSCVKGFAHGLLEHGSPGEEYKRAITFCGNQFLSAPEQDACYSESLSELPGWYSKETSAAICAALPVELQSYCQE